MAEVELGPHLTQCGQGQVRPTSMPSFIFIHPAVWPQYTNVTEKTGQTDNGPIGQGKPF